MDAVNAVRGIMNSFEGIVYGTCSYDGRVLPCRAAARIPADARSLLVILFPYYSERPSGNISVYAAVPDYHKVAGGMLSSMCEHLAKAFPLNAFAWFCDNSPVYEVDAAARAGLGVRGDNGLLIHPEYGSYVFIGEIITDLQLPSGGEIPSCAHCGKCKTFCPGHAIGPDGVDQTRCLSFITQKKGELSPEETELVKNSRLVWGCDTCQKVCVLNSAARKTEIEAFTRDIIDTVDEENARELCRERAFGFRGPDVILRNIRIQKEKQQLGSFDKDRGKE